MAKAFMTSPAKTTWAAEVRQEGWYQVVEDDKVIIASECVREDAFLIAAAPELLETCEELRAMAHAVARNWENGDLAVAVRNLVRVASSAAAAIAKATGKAA